MKANHSRLRTYSRRRPPVGAAAADSPSWIVSKRPPDCLFEFVDVKQEVVSEQCDLCRAFFSDPAALKIHLQHCARTVLTGGSCDIAEEAGLANSRLAGYQKKIKFLS